jgi:hypothetical protein
MKETNYYYIKIPIGLNEQQLTEIREKYKPNYYFDFTPHQKELEVEPITKEEFIGLISED